MQLHQRIIALTSCASPPVTSKVSGSPLAFVRRSIFVEKPPRERPSASRFQFPFLRGCVLVRPDDRGIDGINPKPGKVLGAETECFRYWRNAIVLTSS